MGRIDEPVAVTHTFIIRRRLEHVFCLAHYKSFSGWICPVLLNFDLPAEIAVEFNDTQGILNEDGTW